MCYSLNTSILSYSIGLIFGIAAIYTKQFILGMLILGYCQIQLGEAIIWRGIDTSSISLNRIGTLFLKYTLPSHLLFVGIGILFVSKNYIPLLLGILFYVSVLLYYSTDHSIINKEEPDTSYPRNRGCMERDCQNNENRLMWPFKDNWYWIQAIVCVVAASFFMPLKNIVFITVFFFGSYLLTKRFYKSPSTIWCFLAAILAPFVVFVNYLL